MLSDVEENHTPSVMREDDEDEQDSERYGRDSEEVDGNEILRVVDQEGPLGLRRWLHVLDHVPRHRRLGH
jgi:hypothetical protein